MSDISNTTADAWAATYVIRKALVTSTAQVIYRRPKIAFSTSVGGISPTVYAMLEPLSATACAQTSETFIGCLPLPIGAIVGAKSATVQLTGGPLSPAAETQLRQLLAVPGAQVTSRQIAGTDADCIVAVKTEVSPQIQLCLARQGGLLFYSNGEVLIQATSYTTAVDPASLDPPTYKGLSALLDQAP